MLAITNALLELRDEELILKHGDLLGEHNKYIK
jgi:hypothetical protein